MPLEEGWKQLAGCLYHLGCLAERIKTVPDKEGITKRCLKYLPAYVLPSRFSSTEIMTYDNSQLIQLSHDLNNVPRERIALERFFTSTRGEENSFANHKRTLDWLIEELRVSIFTINIAGIN